jgi:hypothetical protein
VIAAPGRRRVAAWLLAGLSIWLLGAGRWGSYVGWPDRSVYLTDVVLLVAGLLLLPVLVDREARGAILRSKYLWPALALAAYALVRLVFDLDHGVVAARDAAPYLYVMVAVLTVAARTRPRDLTWAVAGLTLFHNAWVTLALEVPTFNDQIPLLGPTQPMDLRTDFDATVCGLLAVACLLAAWAAASGRRWVVAAGFAGLGAWSAVLVPAMNNRAGLLALVLAALWGSVLVYSAHAGRRQMGRAGQLKLAGTVVGLAAIVAVLVVAYTPAGQRLVGTFQTASSPEQRTTNARLAVYDKVIDFVGEKPSRQLFGVGFGPDYLKAIDATPIYDPGGTLKVRSPHNFVLGTYARLGVLGALAHLSLVVLGYVLAWRARRSALGDATTQLCALVLVALPVAATVGVVLESPFGAVPYYWAYGILVLQLSAAREEGAAPAPSSTRSGSPSLDGAPRTV